MAEGPSLLVDLRVSQASRERGIPRYCQALVLALAHERPSLEISCLIDPERDPPLRLAELARHVRIIEGTAAISDPGRRFTHYLQSSMDDTLKPVQALFPAELADHHPRLGAIAYDLIPWLFPEVYFGPAGFAPAYLRAVAALPLLDRLFAISESTRLDIIAIAKAHPARVVTIYGGLDETRWPADVMDAARRPTEAGQDPGSLDTPWAAGTELVFQNEEGERFTVSKPFWLYVGGEDFRKNVARLIEAVASLKGNGRLETPLVVACAIRPPARKKLLAGATALGLSPGTDVIVTDYLSDATLGTLLASCMATVFPSIYEGLGLPVLDSYTFGKPALASDSSSLRELVPELCRFDPYSAASIADAMRRLRDDPRVAEESRAFAPHVMAMCTWSAAASKVGEWLDESAEGAEAPADAPPMWVATSLPPEQSGVAFFTQHSLGAPDRPIAFFTPAADRAGLEAARVSLARMRHGLQRAAAGAEILPLDVLAEARRSTTSRPMLFVLGNSEHHMDTLVHLLTHGATPRDLVHLHDVYLGGLLEPYLYRNAPIDTGDLSCPRLLVRRAGVRRFVVNSSAAADLLRYDLGEDAAGVQIDVLFLPIQPSTTRPPTRDGDRLRIGHFGHLGPPKLPDRLVAACDLLASRRPVELVFAGYAVEPYAAIHGLRREYQTFVNAPSDDELQQAMSSVDCAVQLRFPDHGESSGVVNQLLALRRPVVCTRIGSFAELDGIVHLVAPDVSPADLAVAIEQAAESGVSALAESFVAQHSPWVFEARLRELLELDSAAVHAMGPTQ